MSNEAFEKVLKEYESKHLTGPSGLVRKIGRHFYDVRQPEIDAKDKVKEATAAPTPPAHPHHAEAAADEIVSRLYRRFKDWSKRGFGPEDVTWCEVKADVIALMREPTPPAPEGVSWRKPVDGELTVDPEDWAGAAPEVEPVRMILHCPDCGEQHIDEGEWAAKPHRSHECQNCGHVWRPADVATVGVATIQTKGQRDSIPPAQEVEPVAWVNERDLAGLKDDALGHIFFAANRELPSKPIPLTLGRSANDGLRKAVEELIAHGESGGGIFDGEKHFDRLREEANKLK